MGVVIAMLVHMRSASVDTKNYLGLDSARKSFFTLLPMQLEGGWNIHSIEYCKEPADLLHCYWQFKLT